MLRPEIIFNEPADVHLMEQAKNENDSDDDWEPVEILPSHTPLMLPRANTKTL